MAEEIRLPDIGEFEDDVEVIELLVAPGDRVKAEQSLLVLESDKASMEIPAPAAGVLVEWRVAVGDRAHENMVIAVMELDQPSAAQASSEAGRAQRTVGERSLETEPERSSARTVGERSQPQAASEAGRAQRSSEGEARAATERSLETEPDTADMAPYTVSAAPASAHASPSVRRLARELGVNLQLVPGSGRKGRILKEDVQAYVKATLDGAGGGGGVPIAGVHVAAPVDIDFSKFGETETAPLNRIRKLSAANLHRSWVTVPHVTQFDAADITELEHFRKAQRGDAERRGLKLTFLPFIVKACVSTLREFPQFNASLDSSGENLILKRYFHIGVAVDTERGLVVPVVRDADRKGLFEIAAELQELSARARDRKLRPENLQGGSFSISSLGGIGGTKFTPIVNHPEVAILGVSRMEWSPVYRDGEFVPRLMLPLSLSYDHRVIDGADAARFTTRLVEYLGDLRRMLL